MDSLNLSENVFTGSEKDIDNFFKQNDLLSEETVNELDTGLGDSSAPSDNAGTGILASIIGGGSSNGGMDSYNFSDRLNLASGTGANEPALMSPRGQFAQGSGPDNLSMSSLSINGAPSSPGGAQTAAPVPQGGYVVQQPGAPYVQAVQYVPAPAGAGAPAGASSAGAPPAGGAAPNAGPPPQGAGGAATGSNGPAANAPASGAGGAAAGSGAGTVNAAGMTGPAAAQAQQQIYYQQPIYVDQNGQPIYYQQQVNEQGIPIQVQYMQPPQGGYVQPQYVSPDGQPLYPQQQMRPGGYQGGYQNHRGYDNKGYDMREDYDSPRGYRNDRRDNRDRYDSYRDRYDDRRDRRNDRYGDRGGRDNREGANPGRDPLVDEFRNTFGKSRQWGLTDLLGHVVAFCQDQHGSRFIQQRLEVCNDEEKQLVFEEILLVANPLMTDVFGNYVLQKLFEYGTPEQCEQLGQLLAGQAVNLAMQMYGCRVVQKALEYVNTERLMALVSEFESPPVLLRCVHDSNGNHVIQKCIEIVSRVAADAAEHSKEAGDHVASRIQFIIDTFKGRVKELSSHPYGCRVVQRILEHCPNEQKAVILEELRQCCADLVQDCYGNYVIQFVMQHGWEADRAVLIREVQANLLDFSQHKFASNVVEKCLQYASRRDRDEMIWTIINVTFDMNNPVDSKGHCVLESMVRDPYANYVVQKVIDVSDERQRAAILRYVRENINQLRRYTYGKHIIVRLEKLTNEKF